LLLEINGQSVYTRLVGRFNAYNLTAIYGAAVLLGVAPSEALRLLSTLHAAEGRFQYVSGKGLVAIVDYAHTPDALENVLATINDIRRTSQMLFTVVGCGGDRDTTKRPEMARIALKMSDRLILTSDNPRTEDPEKILDDMESGLTDGEKGMVVRITDRRSAIKTAVMMAREGDIILVAGKGHEKYQEVNGVRHHFDDVEELEKLLCSE
jgi:UDP-N-acetylmuramoyl-L-alanyl-D-glutamate--2,6-diaminopimelate ligase